MLEELVKVAIRCTDHEQFSARCSVCHNLAGVREDMAGLRKRRDELVKKLRAMLEEKKVVIIDVR
jgi:hypothetical protein